MSFVQIISANEYIGDSLGKINDNFYNLDDALVSLSAGKISTSGSLSSIFVTDKEYTRISTNVILTKNTIEQFLTPALCDVRLSCSMTEAYTYNNFETDVLYLHPCNGNYISFYNPEILVWNHYELTEVKKFYLRNDSLKQTSSKLKANGVYSVFVYLENNVLKLHYVQALYSNTINNILTRDVVYIDNVLVYAGDHSKRFIGIIRTNSKSNCIMSQETVSLYNYNSLETNIYSSSAINFLTFQNTKIAFNTSVPKDIKAVVLFRNKDKKTTTLYEVDELSYFNNFIIELEPSCYSLTLSTSQITNDALVSTTIKT